MRIADSQIYGNATRHSLNARARVAQATERLSSGYRISHPGDDPRGAAIVNRDRETVTRLHGIQEGVALATSELDVMDGALGSVSSILARARELTVQLANDSYDASGRNAGADEIAALKQAMVSALNVDFGGRYLFSGTATDTPPFDATGAYLGDTGTRRVEVAPGVTDDVSVRADVYLKGTAGGVDVFAVLDTLEAALRANDAAAIRANLTDIDTSIDQVSGARSEVGTTTNVLQVAYAAHTRVMETATAEAAHIGETDVIVGSTELAQTQNALEAVLAASAKSFKLSLLDRL